MKEKQIDVEKLKADEKIYMIHYKNGDNPILTKTIKDSRISEDCIVLELKVKNVFNVKKSLSIKKI